METKQLISYFTANQEEKAFWDVGIFNVGSRIMDDDFDEDDMEDFDDEDLNFPILEDEDDILDYPGTEDED